MRTARIAVVLVLVASATILARAARSADPPPPPALETLPATVGTWQGQDAGPLDDETLAVLKADSYINRLYTSESAAAPIGLYTAYYAKQRPGVSIHSPLHCLPGTGWEALDVATRTIDRPDGSHGSLRRLVVRKERDRAVVLYWYAIHGRMIGNEVLSKAWLLHDSIRFQRSDAALVRVVVPVGQSVEAAERDGLAFVRSLLPHVSRLWS